MKHLFLLALLLGCTTTPPPTPEPLPLIPPTGAPLLLSDWHLFAGKLADLQANAGVIPYEVNAVLYADGTLKDRALYVPPGGKIHWDPQNRWTFPQGTALIKTFYVLKDARQPELGRRLLETRLLALQKGLWIPQVYLWRDDQSEADRWIVGQTLTIAGIDADGHNLTFEYRVPNTGQCKNCHGQPKELLPLGPRTEQLNRNRQGVNQIAHLQELGLFDAELPDPQTWQQLTDPLDETQPIDKRARAYLEANCAHCHGKTGDGGSSGLWLDIAQTEPIALGVCRRPVAAAQAGNGFTYDIVPGKPEESLLIHRVSSLDLKTKMPPLPTYQTDPFAVKLLSAWIAAMPATGCEGK